MEVPDEILETSPTPHQAEQAADSRGGETRPDFALQITCKLDVPRPAPPPQNIDRIQNLTLVSKNNFPNFQFHDSNDEFNEFPSF